ncbi:MAG TPA: non-heme iron oxygenase ferredoxin subunit [Phototrophicaceae bacterium]|nr:non-heme iron oxygenase ferredoxin subunit [Phototrophicaceae bacterium]
MAEFVTVATTDEIQPGDRIVVEVGDVWVVIFNVDGQYYAVEDMCTHEEYYLSEGHLDGFSLECAKHGAQFDVRTGKVLAPPALIPVKTFQVQVVGDEVQVARR